MIAERYRRLVLGLVCLLTVGATSACTQTPARSVGPKPTTAPIVAAFQAKVGVKDFQFEASMTGSVHLESGGRTVDGTLSGGGKYAGGNSSSSMRMDAPTLGKSTVQDDVLWGRYEYSRADRGPWGKKVMADGYLGTWGALFAPKRQFAYVGQETKGGKKLHRLDLIDDEAFAKESSSEPGPGNAAVTIWVQDDGTPQFLHMDQSGTVPVSGTAVNAVMVMDFTFVKFSGISISPPNV